MCKKLVCLVLFTWAFGLTAAQAERIEWVRAAYWDARYPSGWIDDTLSIMYRDGLAAAGYEILNADQLRTWMEARIADGKYSVVVFCKDNYPDTVVEPMTTCALRRYLQAGGKAVHMADIPFYNEGHVGQVRTNWANNGAPNILGFDTSPTTGGVARNRNQVVTLTPAGIRWGLVETWSSNRPASPTGWPNMTILATDNAGSAAAWVQHFVEGDTFRGFVRIWDFDVTTAKYPSVAEIIRVAEYDGPSALNPNPKNGATGVTMPLLQWTACDVATLQHVYMGTDRAAVAAADASSPEYKGAKSVAEVAYFSPVPLEAGKTYFWRIDQVDAGGVVYAGDVWSFTASPNTAWAPQPADGAAYVALDAQLQWTAGLNAFNHDVYLGTDRAAVEAGAPETKVASKQMQTSFTPAAALERGTTYFWRVDEVAGAAATTGAVWSFTVQPVIAKADPSLIGWWKLDDENSGTAVDSSGSDHYGRLVGNPQWVEGYAGEALKFDGIDDYVDLGNPSGWPAGASPRSLCAWAKTAVLAGGWRWIAAYGTGANTLAMFIGQNGLDLYGGGYGDDISKTGFWDLDTWHHICLAYDGTTARLYADGVEVASAPKTWNLTLGRAHIGRQVNDAAEFWSGQVDDVRLYNVALTPEQVGEVMQGDPLVASERQPARDAVVDIRNAVELSWSAGATAAKHDVYFGTDKEAVKAAGTGAAEYLGRQTATSFDLAGRVAFGGGDYFWRIDEVEADGTTIHTGDVWRFTVAGALLIDDFESYNDLENQGTRIYESWIDGWASKDNGSTVGNWDPPFAERTIFHGGRQSLPMDYNNAGPFFYSEAYREFSPAQDWTVGGVDTLSLWIKGRGVRFLETAPGQYTISSTSGDISGTNADHFRFVYKRLSGDGSIIAKVNSLSATHEWSKGGVMIRETLAQDSMRAHMIVTGVGRRAFENRPTTGGASVSSNTARGTNTFPFWVKIERQGNQFTGSFSQDGVNWTPQAASTATPNPQTINMGDSVYLGLCVTSNNLGWPTVAEISDIVTTGSVSGDWTVVEIGAATSVNPANDADDLYVAVQDKSGKVGVAAWPNGAILYEWTSLTIPLSQFAGVNMSAVTKIFVGVGDRNNPQPDGIGKVYFDDIQVRRGE